MCRHTTPMMMLKLMLWMVDSVLAVLELTDGL